MAVQVIRRHEIAPQVPSIGMRTCCYVRVSSLSDEQSGSYSSQTTHFETMIKSDPEQVYAGTSGTRVSLAPASNTAKASRR